jgi:hypothetical protein
MFTSLNDKNISWLIYKKLSNKAGDNAGIRYDLTCIYDVHAYDMGLN